MLVDSDYERRTLRQLRHQQAWLNAKRGVALAIEKPVFDLGVALYLIMRFSRILRFAAPNHETESA